MAISGITSVGGSGVTQASQDAKGLSDNYQLFLTLLTTQLKNQSPLSPMDANQFTSQLVQYSSVEQAIKMNSNLEEMKSALAISNATSLLAYVGTNVTADGAKTVLQDNKAQWNFTVPRAATAEISVKDSSGNVVYTKTVNATSGSNSFVWNGVGNDNRSSPDGTYSISITAKDSAGDSVKASTDVSGVVEALDFTDGQPYLVIGGAKISIWSVNSIKAGS
jgi:flagellar basal-body rod modification protein FlgD